MEHLWLSDLIQSKIQMRSFLGGCGSKISPDILMTASWSDISCLSLLMGQTWVWEARKKYFAKSTLTLYCLDLWRCCPRGALDHQHGHLSSSSQCVILLLQKWTFVRGRRTVKSPPAQLVYESKEHARLSPISFLLWGWNCYKRDGLFHSSGCVAMAPISVHPLSRATSTLPFTQRTIQIMDVSRIRFLLVFLSFSIFEGYF